VLSRLFRAKFADYLRRAFHHGELSFHGQLQPLAQKHDFITWLNRIARTEWVVYAKPPFGGPHQVLKYLARYPHRVAIANQRLVALQDGHVSFRWKDYRHASQPAVMTLQATEFIRRFLLHVLPRGFVKIRHFGFRRLYPLMPRAAGHVRTQCPQRCGHRTRATKSTRSLSALQRGPDATG
jgi:hypothetical protein